MRKKIINRAAAAGAVVLFFAAVRPDTQPKMWITAALAIALYEASAGLVRALRTASEAKKPAQTLFRVNREDARRWADEWFNPLHEVS